MITPEDLAAAFAVNTRILGMQLDGLTHEDALIQAPHRMNCMNWVLGHIAESRDRVLAALRLAPQLTAAERRRYASESDPVTGDGPDVVPLERLRRVLAAQQERISTVLPVLTGADLDAPAGAAGDDSLAARLFGLYFHETYHTGQTELLRQLAGTDDRII